MMGLAGSSLSRQCPHCLVSFCFCCPLQAQGAARPTVEGSSLRTDRVGEGTCCPLGRGRALQQVGFDYLGVTRPLVMQTAPILGHLITLKDLERGLSRALTH